MAVKRSSELYARAKKLIPGGTQTISKRPERYVESKWPAYWHRARGARRCGAGGGRIMAEEKLGSRISETRVKMAAETKASTLVSNCPFCLTMFEDGVKGAELDGQLAPKDIAEILVERLEA